MTFQNYLENFGRYTTGIPNAINLSLSPDDLVTIRFVAIIVPENSEGYCEVVPTAYNYQTIEEKDPKNFIGASFHLGTGVRTDGVGKQKVFLVKTNKDGKEMDTWFKITNKSKINDIVQESVLGTQNTSIGSNRVVCFQIPRKQDNEYDDDDYFPIIGKGSGNMVPVSICQGNVSFGTEVAVHKIPKLDSYEREPESVPTLTFAYYYTTTDGKFQENDIKEIISSLDEAYNDTKALWRGSLVTGKGDYINTEHLSPPIKLKPLSNKDEKSILNKLLLKFPSD